MAAKDDFAYGTHAPRILHVTETCMGGIASYLQEIIPYQIGVFGANNVHLLIPNDHVEWLDGIESTMVSTFRKTSRIPHRSEQRGRTGRNIKSFVSFFFSLRQCVRSFRPDIVHIHSSFGGAIARPMLALRYPSVRIVYCPHGWAFQMEVPEWKKLTYALIERTLSYVTDIIINISRHEDETARSRGIPKSKCRVVRNGIALRNKPMLTSVQFDESYINLLFVGRFSRQKGLDLLFQVMRRIEDLRIRLYAVGCTVESIDVTPNVTVIEWLPRERIDAYYAAADAVVVPSRWEGFALVPIEAMRAGTAVISSNRCSLPELVRHGINGYIFDIDDTDLVGLEMILRNLDKDNLHKMGVVARKNFEQEFTSEKMNIDLIGIYTELQNGIN